jgi:outer membrane protein assembly factor BamB
MAGDAGVSKECIMTGHRKHRFPRRQSSGIIAVATLATVATITAAWAIPAQSPDNTDDTNGTVYNIEVVGNIAYLAGDFTSVGGQSRDNLAAIDLTTGRVTDWNPGANRAVYGIAVAPDGTLYIGGKFSRVDGERHRKFAQVNAAGNVLDWNPSAAGGRVETLAVNNGVVYVGGRFTAISGVSRNYAAALDATSGDVLPWDPGLDGHVWDLKIDGGGDVWIAGKFREVNGDAQRGLVEVHPGTANKTSFRVDAAVRIPALDIDLNADGSRIYVAGGGGGGRVFGYALDTSTGALLWQAQTDGDMQAIAVSPQAIYAGGHQSLVDGQPRTKIAAFDPETGALLDWAPDIVGGKGPWEIVVTSSGLLVGGDFHHVQGEPHMGFTRFPGTP